MMKGKQSPNSMKKKFFLAIAFLVSIANGTSSSTFCNVTEEEHFESREYPHRWGPGARIRVFTGGAWHSGTVLRNGGCHNDNLRPLKCGKVYNRFRPKECDRSKIIFFLDDNPGGGVYARCFMSETIELETPAPPIRWSTSMQERLEWKKNDYIEVNGYNWQIVNFEWRRRIFNGIPLTVGGRAVPSDSYLSNRGKNFGEVIVRTINDENSNVVVGDSNGNQLTVKKWDLTGQIQNSDHKWMFHDDARRYHQRRESMNMNEDYTARGCHLLISVRVTRSRLMSGPVVEEFCLLDPKLKSKVRPQCNNTFNKYPYDFSMALFSEASWDIKSWKTQQNANGQSQRFRWRVHKVQRVCVIEWERSDVWFTRDNKYAFKPKTKRWFATGGNSEGQTGWCIMN